MQELQFAVALLSRGSHSQDAGGSSFSQCKTLLPPVLHIFPPLLQDLPLVLFCFWSFCVTLTERKKNFAGWRDDMAADTRDVAK